MFERNSVDNRPVVQRRPIPVRILLDDGELLRGRLLVPTNRRLSDELNAAEAFVEFEPYGADPTHLAKTAIRSIRETNVPAPRPMDSGVRVGQGFDPYHVLGVRTGADLETIKKAYHALARAYHPDRYVAIDVPDEVLEYLSAMSRRINLAFEELEAVAVQAQRRAAPMAPTVWTSAAAPDMTQAKGQR